MPTALYSIDEFSHILWDELDMHTAQCDSCVLVFICLACGLIDYLHEFAREQIKIVQHCSLCGVLSLKSVSD